MWTSTTVEFSLSVSGCSFTTLPCISLLYRFLSQTCPLPLLYPARFSPSFKSSLCSHEAFFDRSKEQRAFLSISRGLTACLNLAQAVYVQLFYLQLQSSLLEEFNSSLTPSLYIIVSQRKFSEKIGSWNGLLLEALKLANHFLKVYLRHRLISPTFHYLWF